MGACTPLAEAGSCGDGVLLDDITVARLFIEPAHHGTAGLCAGNKLLRHGWWVQEPVLVPVLAAHYYVVPATIRGR